MSLWAQLAADAALTLLTCCAYQSSDQEGKGIYQRLVEGRKLRKGLRKDEGNRCLQLFLRQGSRAPYKREKQTGLGKTLLQIVKNIQRADPEPWQCAPGGGHSSGPSWPEPLGASFHVSWHISTSLSPSFPRVLCRLRCFLSSSNIKEGASGAYSCNTHTTLTGATSTNFPELPNSTAASKFYLHVYVYEPSAYPSSHLPAFSLFSTIGKKIVCQFRFLVWGAGNLPLGGGPKIGFRKG